MIQKYNINPKVLHLDSFDYEEGLKFSLIPAMVDDKSYFVANEENLIDALNLYSKIDQKF